jgi:ATP-dependent Zn protease
MKERKDLRSKPDSSILGNKAAKEEIMESVYFLKGPKKY